ncbi:MAG: antitoxin MazE [Lacticaseibacillus rhamnosus]
METTICKIGDSVGVIFPQALQAEVGKKYKISKVKDTFVLTPLRSDLFAAAAGWQGFRDAVTDEDLAWDEIED